MDKIINGDFVRMHNIRDTIPVEAIFRIICKSPGEIIIARDLAQEFDLDYRTIQQYLNYLEQWLLIRKVYNYSKSPSKTERRNKRYYPYYTSLHWYIHPYPVEFGKKAETEVAFQLAAEYFWNDRGKEIDFIVGENLDVGVEVKMRRVVTNKQVRSLINSSLISNRYIVVRQDTEVRTELSYLPLHRVGELKQ